MILGEPIEGGVARIQRCPPFPGVVFEHDVRGRADVVFCAGAAARDENDAKGAN
jgi:hypothetical protein